MPNMYDDIEKVAEAIRETYSTPGINPLAGINLIKLHWINDRQKFEEVIAAKDKAIEFLREQLHEEALKNAC